MVERLMVIGAGQMGSGIAQVAAQAGLTVRLFPLLKKYVNAGFLGRKSGQEFYSYK